MQMKYYLVAYHLPVETKSFVEFKNEMIYSMWPKVLAHVKKKPI